jgi:hypothetical protein
MICLAVEKIVGASLTIFSVMKKTLTEAKTIFLASVNVFLVPKTANSMTKLIVSAATKTASWIPTAVFVLKKILSTTRQSST